MSRPCIALLANQGNLQAQAIAQAIEGQGGQALVLNIGKGDGSNFIFAQDQLLWGGVDFSRVDAVHMVCAAATTPICMPPLLNEATHGEYRTAFVKEQQHQASFMAFLRVFAARGGLVINPLPGAFGDHDSKTQFYEKIRAWGLDTPRSLTTNDPTQALEFLDRVGNVVIKPAMGVGPTRTFARADLEHGEDFALAPVLLQKRVTGDTLRVHIVGSTVVCTLKVEGSGLDSRSGERRVFPDSLPKPFERDLLRVNQLLGLHYAAWDLIRSPEGTIYCLDCNPGTYILWVGKDLATSIIDRLAIYMVTYCRSHCLETASHAVSPVL